MIFQRLSFVSIIKLSPIYNKKDWANPQDSIYILSDHLSGLNRFQLLIKLFVQTIQAQSLPLVNDSVARMVMDFYLT